MCHKWQIATLHPKYSGLAYGGDGRSFTAEFLINYTMDIKKTSIRLAFGLLLLAASPAAMRAQFAHPEAADHDHAHEGRIFAGGALTYWRNTKAETTTFSFNPELGYLFNDTWGTGLLLGYEYGSARKAGGVRAEEYAVKVSPIVRYYYVHKGPFNLFMDAGAGYNLAVERKGGETERHSGFEVGVRPGGCVDLTEGLCLCLRFGFVGYRNGYFSGEEPGLGHDGFGLRFAPEELMIGLELEF